MQRYDTRKWQAVYEGEPKKTFTPEEVTAQIEAVKKEHQDALSAVSTELDALKKRANLTTQERAELEKRVEETQKKLLTAEELAKREQEKLKKEADSRIANLEQETQTWRKRYVDENIARSLTDAANAADAYRAEQIVALLRPSTVLQEVKSEAGEVTGFETMVHFRDIDAKGKPVELNLTPQATVKRMAELPDYQNLFKSRGSSGTGRQTSTGSKEMSAEDAAKAGPEVYREWRKTHQA